MAIKQRMLSVVLTLCFWCGLATADTISIRADHWFPINGDPDSETPGYMIELATRIFGDAGHTVDYQLMPWKRAILFVREGRYNCVVGANHRDTPDFVFPTVNWGPDITFVYVKKGQQWRYTGLPSLESIQLGVIGGYAYNDTVAQYIQANKDRLQIHTSNHALENNIKKLLLGRITATIESALVMKAKLKDMGHEDEIISVGQIGETTHIHIACSPALKSSKALMKLVDEGTHKLRQSGELQTILDKYGIEDWVH